MDDLTDKQKQKLDKKLSKKKCYIVITDKDITNKYKVVREITDDQNVSMLLEALNEEYVFYILKKIKSCCC